MVGMRMREQHIGHRNRIHASGLHRLQQPPGGSTKTGSCPGVHQHQPVATPDQKRIHGRLHASAQGGCRELRYMGPLQGRVQLGPPNTLHGLFRDGQETIQQGRHLQLAQLQAVDAGHLLLRLRLRMRWRF